MLLIAEIILTIVTWRRGWKRWTLLPLAIALALALMLGAALSEAGVQVENVLGLCLMPDLFAIVTLIIMTTRAPKRRQQVEYDEAPAKPVAAGG